MYGSYRQVDKWKEIIKKYNGRYGMLAKCEAEEVELAYKSIADIQDRCSHRWADGALFTSAGRMCEMCDISESDFPKRR